MPEVVTHAHDVRPAEQSGRLLERARPDDGHGPRRRAGGRRRPLGSTGVAARPSPRPPPCRCASPSSSRSRAAAGSRSRCCWCSTSPSRRRDWRASCSLAAIAVPVALALWQAPLVPDPLLRPRRTTRPERRRAPCSCAGRSPRWWRPWACRRWSRWHNGRVRWPRWSTVGGRVCGHRARGRAGDRRIRAIRPVSRGDRLGQGPRTRAGHRLQGRAKALGRDACSSCPATAASASGERPRASPATIAWPAPARARSPSRTTASAAAAASSSTRTASGSTCSASSASSVWCSSSSP